MLRKISLFVFVVFFFMALLIIAVGSRSNWADAFTTHTLVQKNNSRLELEWVQTVFTIKIVSRQLAATSGRVFFVGSLAQNEPGGLIALDGESGKELWQAPEADTVDVSPDMVYVDYRDSVVAYTLTGEKLWRTRLRVNNIATIDAVDGKLYVGAYGAHLLDAVTGELLATSSLNDIFVGNFAPGLFYSLANTPAFTEHRVFTRDGNSLVGAAIALDRQSGDILWQSADNVISNVGATESLAFVITHEDELRILDAATGKLLETIQIEPSIKFYELAAETNVQHRGYFLAADEANRMLYVLLGDSNQLFAFRIKSGR
jgi:outer membrane protein assembly factor BamB